MSEDVRVIDEILKIERKLEEIEHKLEELIEASELYGVVKLSEESLREFLESEPDLYSYEDLKVRFK
ncbi:hypothetical protein E3E35_05910 [Thermococcus sp. GR7]|uniref:hypothetical protein n=1 Tax=unclassified Thermococcus TaxID=2627626 RepID=UPI0014321497|nr:MULTISPECIES: hypothetical protein [unclassified Thermococcus]NJE46949.1 hypothetical protein [Thermococcus sp. GR7]NJE79569.1 hypothetical protein [Thermococcus sp. GR4]NJF22657.1 hypothetical protein [Thermococcus sp. GR5]